MAERMTWEEIKKAYPDKWVGLTQIEWKDGANVRSAIVDYVGDTSDDPLRRQIAGEDIQTIYTGMDDMCPLGGVTLFA